MPQVWAMGSPTAFRGSTSFSPSSAGPENAPSTTVNLPPRSGSGIVSMSGTWRIRKEVVSSSGQSPVSSCQARRSSSDCSQGKRVIPA